MAIDKKYLINNTKNANMFIGKLLVAMNIVALVTIFLWIVTPKVLFFFTELKVLLLIDNLVRISLCVWIFISKGENALIKYAIAAHFILMAVSFSMTWCAVLWPLFAMGVAYSVRYCSKRYTLSIGAVMIVFMILLEVILIPRQMSNYTVIDYSTILPERIISFIPQCIAMIGYVIVLGFSASSNLRNLEMESLATEKMAAAAQAEMERKALEEKSRQLEIVSALSRDYLDVFLINTREETLAIIKNAGIMVEVGDPLFEKYQNYYMQNRQIIESLVHPEDKERMLKTVELENIKSHIKRDGVYTGLFRTLQNGELHYISYKYIPIEDTDLIISGFSNADEFVREEEEKKAELKRALEAEKRANMAKTDFLFNMSHDIRTPMNAIVGFTDLILKDTSDSEKIENYGKKIQAANSVLLNLINNVLEMARIESGNEKVEEVPFFSNKFTEELKTVMETPMKAKNISFEISTEINHTYLLGDVTKLQEIFLNLLSNAVKYTNEGGKISLKAEEIEDVREGYINIRTIVKDTGIGMSSEYIPKLFDEFSREKSTTESGISGTGLGMSIVKKMIELMGGSISVESQINKGSTFTVIIPHRLPSEDIIKTVENKSHNIGENFAGKRILLAEDNELNAEIACNILEELGFEVETAEDGVICIEKLSARDEDYYDLILMDIQMPNTNGYDATSYIRKNGEGKRKNIPIVAMTANAFAEDKEKAKKVGMNGHVSKPINIKQLIEELSLALDK